MYNSINKTIKLINIIIYNVVFSKKIKVLIVAIYLLDNLEKKSYKTIYFNIFDDNLI